MVRTKLRYFVCRLRCQEPAFSDRVTTPVLIVALREAINRCHGDWGSGRASHRLRMMLYRPQSGLFVFRALRSSADIVMSSLVFLSRIKAGTIEGESKVAVDVIYVSGTIRCCEKFLVSHYKQDPFLIGSSIEEFKRITETALGGL